MPNLDASSPARFTGTPANGVPINSGSFSPPDNSFIVVHVNADSVGGGDITVSVSGGGLTWTNRVERDEGDAGAESGHASIWTAELITSASISVDVTRTAGSGSTNRISVKIEVWTDVDLADPVGAVGEGSSTSNNITPIGYVSTVDNSRGVACATDWNQNGVPTSTDDEDGADYAGAISVVSLHKAADTPLSGSNVTFNFDAAGAGAAAWNWVAIELKPGGSLMAAGVFSGRFSIGAAVVTLDSLTGGAQTYNIMAFRRVAGAIILGENGMAGPGDGFPLVQGELVILPGSVVGANIGLLGPGEVEFFGNATA